MNAGFAYLCLKGASLADVLDKDRERLSDELGTRLSFALSPLHEVFRLFTILYALVSIGLVVVLVTNFV